MAACLDQGVELLVTADGELQMTRRDTLHLQGCSCQVAWDCKPDSHNSAPKSGVRRTHLRVHEVVGWEGQEPLTLRTLRSLDALPASSSTSAVRYSATGRAARQMATPSQAAAGVPLANHNPSTMTK